MAVRSLPSLLTLEDWFGLEDLAFRLKATGRAGMLFRRCIFVLVWDPPGQGGLYIIEKLKEPQPCSLSAFNDLTQCIYPHIVVLNM